MEKRNYWGFTHAQKEFARDRAGGLCEFPAGCDDKNTGQVNHITGSLEGRLAGFPREVIQDVTMNSALLCHPHEIQHDIQEQEHIASIPRSGVIYEARPRATIVYESRPIPRRQKKKYSPRRRR